MAEDTLTHKALAGFTGSSEFFWHALPGVPHAFLYTEGVRFVAERAGAYWLLDLIGNHQLHQHVRRESFQKWRLVVDLEENTAGIVCDDGDGTWLTGQRLGFTDFPLRELDLFFINDGFRKTLLLPSEY